MLRTTVLLIFIFAINAISAENINRLRRTKELNFSFYYEHVYPEPDDMVIVLEFTKITSNLSQGIQGLRSSFAAIVNLTRSYNATIVSQPFKENAPEEVLISFEANYTIYSVIQISVAPQAEILNGLLTELVNLDQKQLKVILVERTSLEKLNQDEEEAKAIAGATERGKQICKKYFNMNLKNIISFEKESQDKQKNETEEEEEEGFTGSYQQILLEIGQQKIDEQAISLNQIYNCRIICENTGNFASDLPSGKKIDSKLAEEKVKEKSKQQKQKSKATSSKPLKKGKSINPEKYQRNAQNQL